MAGCWTWRGRSSQARLTREVVEAVVEEVAVVEEGDTIGVTVPRMEVGDTVVREEEAEEGGCAVVLVGPEAGTGEGE